MVPDYPKSIHLARARSGDHSKSASMVQPGPRNITRSQLNNRCSTIRFRVPRLRTRGDSEIILEKGNPRDATGRFCSKVPPELWYWTQAKRTVDAEILDLLIREHSS